MKQGTQKYLLKQLLYELVPKELFERPKRGFSIPLNQWLTGPLKYLIEETLSKTEVEEAGIVHWTEVQKLKEQFFNGHNYLYNCLWLLICLHRWFQVQRVSS
jgi:asparagine synthase (glutamine-hydrolysing)